MPTNRVDRVDDGGVIPLRRRLLGGAAAWSLGAAAALSPLPSLAQQNVLASRYDSRARYKLLADFSCPPNEDVLVPWDVVFFQSGSDFTLQPNGKVSIHTHGLYECVLSSDWQLATNLDIDMRQIGVRLQRKGEPDTPMDLHERIGFFNTPASDPPRIGRYQGRWAVPALAPSASTSVDITPLPLGTVRAGDMATAAHMGMALGSMGKEALAALVIDAKVVAQDTVTVTVRNLSPSETIQVPTSTLKVMAMSAQQTRGNSGDAWMIVHTASVEMFPGDQVYAMVRHKVEGTLLQTTRSTYLQLDRVA